MKNIPFVHVLVSLMIGVALIAIVIQQFRRQPALPGVYQADTASSSVSVVQTQEKTNSAVTPKTSTQVSSASGLKTIPIIKTSSNQAYTDYVNQLNANKMKCDTAAAGQYKQLYANMLSSAFVSYYIPTTGTCYMSVTGKTQVQYASSTVGHLYFRSVNTGALLTECSDPTGALGEGNWMCTNKSSNASITKAQYDLLVESYRSK